MQNTEAEGNPRHGQPTDMTFQVLLSLGFGPLAPNKGVESMSTRKTRMENPKLVRMHTFISEILLQQQWLQMINTRVTTGLYLHPCEKHAICVSLTLLLLPTQL